MKTTAPAPSKSSYPFPVSQAWYDSVCARLADTLDADRLPEALERLNECMAGHYDPCDEPDATLRLVFKLLLPEIDKAIERSRRARSRRRVRAAGAAPKAPRRGEAVKSPGKGVAAVRHASLLAVPEMAEEAKRRGRDALAAFFGAPPSSVHASLPSEGPGVAPAEPEWGETSAIQSAPSRLLNRRERRLLEMERRRLAKRR